MKGAITSYIDVAQVTLYAFWIFFAGLILYLRREDKREGYPLEMERPTSFAVQGFPDVPKPKTFLLQGGDTVLAPPGATERREIRTAKVSPWLGSAHYPLGDPMLDGVGPASYCERRDEPELLVDGEPMIVPMRVATDTSVALEDADPRGMMVLDADGKPAGVVSDLWIDRGEPQIRYIEVEVAAGGRRVLMPINFASIRKKARQVRCRSIYAAQFATVPEHRANDRVTKLEEDKIMAYFASGYLYGKPSRSEPLV